MIAIIDYGAGNIFSVMNALEYLNIPSVLTADPAQIRTADAIILPGVGAFPDAMRMLGATGLTPLLKEEAEKKRLAEEEQKRQEEAKEKRLAEVETETTAGRGGPKVRSRTQKNRRTGAGGGRAPSDNASGDGGADEKRELGTTADRGGARSSKGVLSRRIGPGISPAVVTRRDFASPQTWGRCSQSD